MRRRHLLVAGLVTLLIAAVLGRVVARPQALPGLGFVAKVVCSDVLVGGTPVARALADLPDEPLARLIRTNVDTAAGRVRASIPLIAARAATLQPGLGCVLDPVRSPAPQLAVPRIPPAAADTRPVRGIPAHMAAPRIEAAIRDAFSEPDPSTPRRTRAIVIMHAGEIIAERYADGFSAAHRFAGWSMAKSVTNALTGIMVGRGALDLRAAALRPEWRADERRDITLHHLMQMSSGLEFDESYTPTGEATRMLFAAGDVAAFAAASPLAHGPGTHWYYSSGTTNIVSWLIRDAFGGDDVAYLSFPGEALFARIGMASAVLEPDASGTFVGSSFMYATARDWARFGQLFLQDGMWQGERVLPEGWVRYSVAPAPAAPRGEYGAHWWLNAGSAADPANRYWPDLPRDIYFASGFQGQYVAVLPSLDMVVVRLGVSADRAWSLGAFLREVVAAQDG
jgi:CubicO group peptidase (beta-lactamase class C family)